MKKDYKYIYGPVFSWRLGRSLGIDPVSANGKICSFDCTYCQIGMTKTLTDKRSIFVSAKDIIGEIKSLPPIKVDYITFAGAGEPTLAENLGDMIIEIKKIRSDKIAVITNSSLIGREDVQKDLMRADFVIAKLDAPLQAGFEAINRSIKTITLDDIIKGIKDFKKVFKGRLALQMMFIDDNKEDADNIVDIAGDINPDEIQINTPLRICNVKPLPKEEILKIKDCFASAFRGIDIISVYDQSMFCDVTSISGEDTLKRRGKVKS